MSFASSRHNDDDDALVLADDDALVFRRTETSPLGLSSKLVCCLQHSNRTGAKGRLSSARSTPFFERSACTMASRPLQGHPFLIAHLSLVQLRGRRLALIVGLCTYDDPSFPDLPACRVDASSMAKLLTRLGYTVDILLDATRTQIAEGKCRVGSPAIRSLLGWKCFLRVACALSLLCVASC
jgi:hypothetical protein